MLKIRYIQNHGTSRQNGCYLVDCSSEHSRKLGSNMDRVFNGTLKPNIEVDAEIRPRPFPPILLLHDIYDQKYVTPSVDKSPLNAQRTNEAFLTFTSFHK
jgi:hypothetical protein